MSGNLLIIGAGNVNFGSDEGPWCHTTRFEKKLGDRLNVVGLVDPDTERALQRIAVKRAAGISGYRDTKCFTSVAEAKGCLEGPTLPAMALLGVQPNVRGSARPGSDLELQVKAHFPLCSLFVEKPITASDCDDVAQVGKALQGTVVSVGYMLRYLKAVAEIRRIILENNLKIMSSVATYFMAYEFAGLNNRVGYFDKTIELGPIVGQATHIVDLSRFICGEAALDSVFAHTVEHDVLPGHLSKLTCEDGIPPSNRIPRITNAIWKWKSGATGALVHAVALHGQKFEAEFVLLADGWRIKLVDPYDLPRLYVRKPDSDIDEIFQFEDDDPFFAEVSAFVDASSGGLTGGESILSTYEDGIRTYELTCAIRSAGERSASQA